MVSTCLTAPSSACQKAWLPSWRKRRPRAAIGRAGWICRIGRDKVEELEGGEGAVDLLVDLRGGHPVAGGILAPVVAAGCDGADAVGVVVDQLNFGQPRAAYGAKVGVEGGGQARVGAREALGRVADVDGVEFGGERHADADLGATCTGTADEDRRLAGSWGGRGSGTPGGRGLGGSLHRDDGPGEGVELPAADHLEAAQGTVRREGTACEVRGDDLDDQARGPVDGDGEDRRGGG